jgi:mitochondrial fission protein ELM1
MMALPRASGGRCFTVQIQDPLVPASRFDLVAVPMHDRAPDRGPGGRPTAENVILTQGALHHVTPEAIQAAAARLAEPYADLPHPLVAVLLGGPNKHFRFTAGAAERLGRGLATLCREHGAGLAVTPSRRTPPEALAMLRAMLDGLPCRIWDGAGENPYLGFLGLADAIIVTGDSVSMTSEACATGTPVHVFDLDGHSPKFARFHAGLRDAGITRRFDGTLTRWRYRPLDDTARVATEIRRRLGSRGEMPVAPPSPLP